MARQLKVTVLADVAAIPDNDPDFTAVPATPTTEYHVIGTLRALGHKVSVLGAVSDVGTIANTLSEQKPDMLFNLTEEFAGDRRQDKNVAALLELLGVAFTGTGTTGLMLCRDKRLCKQLLGLHRIRVPGFVFLPPRQTVRLPKSLCYPLVVKPAFEDSSEGISNASLVTNEAAFSEASQTTAPTNSPGSPNRPIGVCPRIDSVRSRVKILRFCSAGKNPGASAFTRTLYGAHSRAKNWVKLLTPALETLYVKTFESGGPEDADEILIILPPLPC